MNNIGDLIRNAMNQNKSVIEKPKNNGMADLIKSHMEQYDPINLNDGCDDLYSQIYRSNDIFVVDGVECYDTCNYKGEGEGLVVKNAKTEAYPIFVSKNYHMM